MWYDNSTETIHTSEVKTMYNSAAYSAMADYERTMEALAPVFAGILLAVLVMCILCLIAMCKLFKKAGEPVWKVFVPFYGNYTLFKIAGKPSLFSVSLISTLCLALTRTVPAMPTVIALVQLVLHILLCVGLAKSFGKGGGFAAGLIFFYPLFLMILAFGAAKYMGSGAADASSTDSFSTSPFPQGGGAATMPLEKTSMPVQEPRHLVGESGVFVGQLFSVEDSMLLGTRPDACDVVYPRGTPGISGRHCTLANRNGEVFVTDENSTYGTWLDGQRLQPGVPTVLRRGQHLSLGSPKETFTLRN